MMQRSYSNRKRIMIYILLFLFAINVVDQAESVFALLFLASIISFKQGLKLYRSNRNPSNTFIVLVLFSITYIGIALLYNTYSALYVIKRAVYPVAAYYMGYEICRKGDAIDENTSNKVIISLASGFFIYGVLNYMQRVSTSILGGYRTSIDFWNGAELMPTFESTFFLFTMSLTYYFIVCKNKTVKIIGFIAVGVSVVISFATASRTPIVLALGSAIVFELLQIFNRQVSVGKRNKSILRALFLAALIYAGFSLNIFGIQEKVLGSELMFRMNNSSVNTLLDMSQRVIRYDYIFTNFWSHLFGNIDMGNLGSAHNTWLDIFRVSGIIPMLLYIVFTVQIIRKLRQLWKLGLFYREDCLICVLVIACSNALFFVESIIALNITYFWAYLIVCGMVEAKINSAKILQRNNIEPMEATI